MQTGESYCRGGMGSVTNELEYDELQIRISRGRGRSYAVSAEASDGSREQGTFISPFTDIDLENFVLKVGQPRRQVRGYRSSAMRQATLFGTKLGEALLKDKVREVYQAARNRAEAAGRGMRVALYLTDAPELMEIPWEFLWDRRFLAQSTYTPLVRSLDLQYVYPPKRLRAPLRVLAMASSPRGVDEEDELDVDKERENLELALADLVAQGTVELDWLERATLTELERRIGSADDIHVLHFIGHGAYDERLQAGILQFEDERGDKKEVSGVELCSLLHDERSLRLAVLNSCEGARTSHVDPFSGVASALIECGIPAVVAMQFEITDSAAIVFSNRLYTGLAQGDPIDAAVAQTRKAIFAAEHEAEFATPVLFVRGGVARLFQIDVVPAEQGMYALIAGEERAIKGAGEPFLGRPAGPDVDREQGKQPRKSPKATVLRQNGESVDLFVELENESHYISWRTGWILGDELSLNGVVIQKGSTKEHVFELSDGTSSVKAVAIREPVSLISARLILIIGGRKIFGKS